MPEETTVLLVDAHHFHASLEAQLSSRQVYVEHATSLDAVQIASVLVPDLVVVSGKSEADALTRNLSQVKPALPTVVVADRAQVKKLKTLDLPLAALIPHDLPTAAIAHRVATLARKGAHGALLIKPSSRLFTPESASVPDAPAKVTSEVAKPRPGPSHAQTVASQLKSMPPTTPNTKAARSVPAPSLPARTNKAMSIGSTPTPSRAQVRAPSNPPAAAPTTGQTTPGIAPAHQPSPLNRPRAKVKRETTRADSPASLRAQSQIPPPFPAAQREALNFPVVHITGTAAPPQSKASPTTNLEDELSVVAQFPIDLRLSLSSAKKPSHLRLTLLDTDLTRADLLTTALRRKELEIFPVTPEVEQTRWPLLRRFAPQALIVDEKGMSRGSADWVETFRGDPFLRHVPLIVIRYSRLFHEIDQRIDLEPLLTLIEHLGKDENALLEKLAPGRQVDLKLAQLGPVRLLQLLTEQDRNTRIDCRSESERMVWPLGPGYAGKAKLLQNNSEKVLAKLSPQEAFAWLLRHENLDVAVHEHSEPLAHASESEDSVQLLRNVTDALGIPTRHESVSPAAATHAQSPQALRTSSPEVPATLNALAVPALPDTNEPQTIWPRLKQQVLIYYQKYEARLAPTSLKLPERMRVLFAPSVLVILALLVICPIAWALSHSEQSDALPAPNNASEQPIAANAPADAPAAPSPKKPRDPSSDKVDRAGDLWAVAPDSEQPNCEEVVGNKKPASSSPTNAQSYLRQARKLLMAGKTEDAAELMCLSALSDETGLAAEALAEYYLGRRSLMEAQRWVETSLKADPDRRKSQELLADIESQKGNWEESRRILLKTMRLTGNETATLNAIGRKLVADAGQATKGGDLARAERELRRAAVLVPESGGIALELANILAERKMSKAALFWSERAYVLDPRLSAALVVSGRIAAELGDIHTARTYFQRVPAGDPYYQQAAKHLSLL